MTQDQAVPPALARLPIFTARQAFAAGAVLWLGFAVVAAWVLAGGSLGFDAYGLRYWRGEDAASPFLLEAVRDITALGGVTLRNLIALAGLIALAMLDLRREALWLAATVLLGWLANSGAKQLFGRARPDIVPHLMEAGGASFPSGHSFNGAVVCFALALTFAALARGRAARRAIFAAALIISLAIAWSRVWLGVHYPSDVIAGWLGGAGWAFLAAGIAQAVAQPSHASAGSLTEKRPDPREAKRASPTNQPPSSSADT